MEHVFKICETEPLDKVLVKSSLLNPPFLTVENFMCLKPGEWLNGKVINAYLKLITDFYLEESKYDSIFCFSTTFYPKLKVNKTMISV